MKLTLVSFFLLLFFFFPQLLLGGSGPPDAPAKAEHAIIFIIDGLSYKAVDRLPLKNLHTLIAAGTYYEKSYNILPAHPKSGEWAKYHDSSIPNPVILAGTVLLRPDQRYVQHSFFPGRITAHVANDVDYKKLNIGFNLTFMAGSDEQPAHDDQTIAWALRFLREERPAFMKIHLQDTGNAGAASYYETNPAVPWRRNIWAEGSPYRKAAMKADEYLGMLLTELEALGLRDKTVLFVTSDHGESDGGWHPYDDQDGWAMPLVVAGPGVRGGQRFFYAEQTDIVPTLCFLMGVKPPENSDGRILVEALAQPPANVRSRTENLKELNTVLLEGDVLLKHLKQDASLSPQQRDKVAAAERDFYGIERILEWHRFGSVERLLAHNRSVLQKLSTLPHGSK